VLKCVGCVGYVALVLIEGSTDSFVPIDAVNSTRLVEDPISFRGSQGVLCP
jgi:hypothetical protein